MPNTGMIKTCQLGCSSMPLPLSLQNERALDQLEKSSQTQQENRNQLTAAKTLSQKEQLALGFLYQLASELRVQIIHREFHNHQGTKLLQQSASQNGIFESKNN